MTMCEVTCMDRVRNDEVCITGVNMVNVVVPQATWANNFELLR